MYWLAGSLGGVLNITRGQQFARGSGLQQAICIAADALHPPDVTLKVGSLLLCALLAAGFNPQRFPPDFFAFSHRRVKVRPRMFWGFASQFS